ncbi:hypothetical protein D020_2199A, partial [Vibrio parahaemolyticus SBR10290]
MLWRET